MDQVAGAERRALFEQVARELLEPVRRYLARRTDPETAADVLSETLTVVWRRLDEVPADRLPWAIAVAKWQLANAHRGRRRTERLTARLASTGEARRTVPDHADRSTESLTMQRALELVGPAEAELLRLWAWEELTPSEIAVVLGITPNAVSLRLLRARRHLEQVLRQLDAVPGHGPDEKGDRR